MAESTELRANVPVTVSLDINDLVKAYVGEIPTYTGDPDDEMEPPPPLYGEIIGAAAHIVAQSVIRDTTRYGGLKSRVDAQIDAALNAGIVAELEKPFKPVDSYGQVDRHADPTTLREQIGKHAAEWIAKGMKGSRSGYSSDNGALYQYINKELEQLIKTDLKAVADSARAAVTQKVQKEAATVIADIITKTAGVK